MKISRLVTFCCFVTGGACLGQDQSPGGRLLDVIATLYNSMTGNLNRVLKESRPVLKEFEDCGKKHVRNPQQEFARSDCLWDCKWKRNPFYVHSPDREFVYTDYYTPTANITTIITTPRIPEDLTCLSDCFWPSPVFQLCYSCCIDPTNICPQFLGPPPPLPPGQVWTDRDCLFKCYRDRNFNAAGRFYARGPTDMAMEICRISLSPAAAEMQLFPKGDCGTLPDFFFILNADNLPLPPLFPSFPRSTGGKNPFVGKLSESNQILRHSSESVQKDDIRKDQEKIFGSSTFPVDVTPDTKHHPWLCSLRTRGFRGRHRCGVTLLSGPTEDSNDPTILVSAAHCNYICKERETGNVYETCCCRPAESKASCRNTSSYCRGDPIFTLAEPSDLQIVCGEFSVETPEPEISSNEIEIVLDILEIVNHPDYKPNEGPGVGGPIEGNDIAVYKVNDSLFKMTKLKTWPACLPKEEYNRDNLGILVGWVDSVSTYQYQQGSIQDYRLSYFYPRQIQMEEIICRDPAWMGSNTYYPHGTACYRDPSLASCVEFGSSGSGLVRKWRVDPKDGVDQYALVGPLTISKGCDQACSICQYLYRGENAAVVTDVTCFMDWIADQYGLQLPQQYKRKDSCLNGKGDRKDFNKPVCRTSYGTYCNFSAEYRFPDGSVDKWDSCRLVTLEGIAYNINTCIEGGQRFDGVQTFANCANNCRGVDPNAIIGAGVAAVTAGALGAVGLLAPALGIGGIGMAGAAGGAIATRMATCQAPLCRAGNQCCRLVAVRGRIQCPSRC